MRFCLKGRSGLTVQPQCHAFLRSLRCSPPILSHRFRQDEIAKCAQRESCPLSHRICSSAAARHIVRHRETHRRQVNAKERRILARHRQLALLRLSRRFRLYRSWHCYSTHRQRPRDVPWSASLYVILLTPCSDEFAWIGSRCASTLWLHCHHLGPHSYALTATAFLPWSAGLASIFGRRAVLLVSITLFAVGNIACHRRCRRRDFS